MPRVTNNNNANVKNTNGSTSTSNVNVAAAATTKGRKRATIKKEVVDGAGEQNVFHRKSERRRVARDIFLVFEEEPCRRGRGRGGGANNKRKPTQKSKFGHLMVEDPCRTTTTTKAGLLRDIKNEPKCYLNEECTTNAPVATAAIPAPPPAPPPTQPTVATAKAKPTVVAKKEEKKKNTPKANKSKNNNTNNSKNCIESKPIVIPPTKLADSITIRESSTSNSSTKPSEDDGVVCARVNPIFLWVKQEDTHIVEVRCEDYDKRNRIRITKTTNGWRATPRTDPSSSKIVKIIPSTLLKVKKEMYENNLLQKCNAAANMLGSQLVIQQQTQQQQPLHEQQQLEVNEKPRFITTENSMMVENILNCNNSKHGILDNLLINKSTEQQQLETSESSTATTKEKHKNKKAKTKKEGKKRGRKASQLSIPKVEVQVQQQQEYLQETANENDLEETMQMHEQQACISNQKQEEQEQEECRAPLPIEQVIQSNLETIQNFSKMSINDHQQQHNQHSIIENNDTASINNNNLTEAIELHSVDAKEQQAIEAAAATDSTTKAVKEADEETNALQNQNEAEEKKAQTITETYQAQIPHLELCPITGLFLPTNSNARGADVVPERGQVTSASFVAEADDAVVVNTFNTNFLSKDIFVDLANCDDEDDDVAIVAHNLQDSAKLQTHFNTTTMDADTKNLKDLLDEADLMQHCHDHGLASSDADIIDSIVKRSCENNLIQESVETLKEAEAMLQQQQTAPFNVNADVAQHHHHKDLMSNVVPHSSLPLDETVRDSPKCLSFNEAGEIEDLNGQLFQTNHFMDTYEKDSSSVEEVCLSDDGGGEKLETSTTEVTALTSPVHHVSIKESGSEDDVIMEETPKDLSYKKREEVCPQSESRSQCAVTSSSDIIKSPQQQQQGELPAIETTSEAIKNLILEQFMKLNTYNVAATNPVNVVKPQQQVEPINLGKAQQQHDLTTPTPPTTTTTNNDCNSNYAPTTNYIETVVIDDNSDDEPMKKRMRSSSSSNNVKVNKALEAPEVVVGSQTHHTAQASIAANTAALLNDKDPDPLTQLQLLIRNTQWKVPDPILVPKDRLRAVLASPAREIPLLITTRPELRLPEAFAYPEIIQNPNILVISMAQLEAILKNEMEMEQSKLQAQEQQQQQQQQQCIAAATTPMIHQHELPIEAVKKSSNAPLTNNNTSNNSSHHNKPHHIEHHTKSIKVKESPSHHTPLHAPAAATPPRPTALPQPQPPPPKCTHVDNNLATDINAATLAVLNQMLWLPYFGQLSQEFMKTLNKPMGVQNKYNTSGLLPPPLYNHHMGLQHVDEMYKNYLKQMTALKHLSAEATNVSNAMPNFPLALGAFQPTMETNMFQKMLQHQMANFLNINPLAATAATGASTPIQSVGGQQHHVGKSPAAHEMSTANVDHMHMSAALEDKKPKSNTTATTHTNADMNGGLVGDAAASADKLSSSSSIRNHNNKNNVTLSADNGASTESVNYNKYAYAMQQHQQQQPHQQQKQEIDNKPRLTCKSLSNLLEPAESVSSSPIAPPLFNLTTDHHHHALRSNTTTAHELAHTNVNTNSLINPASIHNKESAHVTTATSASAVDVMPHFKSGKLSSNNKLSNIGLNAAHEVLVAKQRKRAMSYAAEAALATSPAMGAVAAAAASAASLGNQTPSRNVAGENINVEPNQALWHPLFGSNTKTGYSSPWQWTTVTATGE